MALDAYTIRHARAIGGERFDVFLRGMSHALLDMIAPDDYRRAAATRILREFT